MHDRKCELVNIDWEIRPPEKRLPGLSAMIRVKNEAEWCCCSLESVASWCDDIVIALQGEQTDGTDKLIYEWAGNKECVYEYPFDSWPNGPGHDQHPTGSVYERAYFYNWTLAKTKCTHVVKWDLDMVAMDDAGEKIRAAMESHDFVRFEGAEIVERDPLRVSREHPTANIETRVFPADRCRFVTGQYCEALEGQPSRDEQYTIPGPMYLHFKWCKRDFAQAWPEDWRQIPHFQRLTARAKVGRLYDGPVPSVL